MLIDAKKDCIHFASLLGDYQSISINDLANGYCLAIDENDESGKNKYLSALILRFWYTIDKMYKKSSNIGLDREDFFGWLVEAIDYACKYRAWQNPEKNTNAQAAINQCINTIRLQHYYEYNLDKHRANYNTMSLDAPINDGEDQSLYDIFADGTVDLSETMEATSEVNYLVQSFINKKKIIEAIIFDNIAYNDVEKHTKKTIKGIDNDNGESYKYTKYSHEFWPYKLVQVLGSLTDSYQNYFMSKYDIVPAELSAAFEAIKKANNQKLYKYVSKALADARADLAAYYC